MLFVGLEPRSAISSKRARLVLRKPVNVSRTLDLEKAVWRRSTLPLASYLDPNTFLENRSLEIYGQLVNRMLNAPTLVVSFSSLDRIDSRTSVACVRCHAARLSAQSTRSRAGSVLVRRRTAAEAHCVLGWKGTNSPSLKVKLPLRCCLCCHPQICNFPVVHRMTSFQLIRFRIFP